MPDHILAYLIFVMLHWCDSIYEIQMEIKKYQPSAEFTECLDLFLLYAIATFFFLLSPVKGVYFLAKSILCAAMFCLTPRRQGVERSCDLIYYAVSMAVL